MTWTRLVGGPPQELYESDWTGYNYSAVVVETGHPVPTALKERTTQIEQDRARIEHGRGDSTIAAACHCGV